ncbi:hypothetical protein [Streptomyces uncialis]|uniref:hypothetical protein n=1 Tax=Streptomyces uncialis TaxID=1048205 RepID=UPI00224E2160|nr:hypothetical protein [Streptomyces uncialis]MCX4664389.1 hypothetical protein [Streptomyces uncialis]
MGTARTGVTRRSTLLSLCALVLGPLLLITGCGFLALTACEAPGDRDDPRPRATVPAEVLRALRTASTVTRQAGSARVTAVMTMGDRVSTRTTGTLGWRDGLNGALTIRYTGGTLVGTLRGLDIGTTEARFVDGVYYARMSDAFAAESGGRHWVRHPHDSSANFAPNQSVELLLAAPDTRRTGRETVRGVPATRYTGTLRPADLPTRGPAADESAELRDQLRAAGVTEERVDVWIDGAGRLVKRAERSETAAGTLHSTAYYRQFGVRVAPVTAPPPADTVDYAALLPSRGGQ